MGKLILDLRNPENIAVICPNHEQYTYEKLRQYSHKLAQKMASRSLIFCFCQNTMGSLLGYLASITNDIVPLLLNPELDQELLQNLIRLYNPHYYWLPDTLVEKIPGCEKITGMFGYTLLKNNQGDHFELHEDLALLLTTSGSTGSPKLVRLTHENINANADAISQYLSIDKNERPITSLPMHYSFGLSIINSHLLNGATILLTNHSIMEKQFWSFLKTYKATSISGVPYTYEILKKLRFNRMDLPHLKTMTQAGGKIDEFLSSEFSKFCKNSGKRFFVMYGQAEATARMSYLPPAYSISKPGSMGIAIPGGKFSLIDEKGSIIDMPEKQGELVYKGKNVSMGYARSGEDLIKGNENQGILVTGDMAKRDSDGFYYIVGRKKRFIKLFGNRVNLDETERLLKHIIHDCACVGEDDNMTIYITDDSRIDEVREYISRKTGINPKGFKIKCIDEIAKNSSGKTEYSKLAAKP